MSEELKPCPFCGSAAMLEELGDHHGHYHNLGCSIRECPAYHVIYTENEAPISESVAWWNRRAQPERKLTDELPALPHTTYNGYSDGSEPLYTADQMREYALLAAQPASNPVIRDFRTTAEPSNSVGANSAHTAGAIIAALEIGLECANEVAEETHSKLKGYRPHRHAAVDADVKKIEAAIALLKSEEAQPAEATVPDLASELLLAVIGLKRVIELAVTTPNGKQYAYIETRNKSFVHVVNALEMADAVIAKCATQPPDAQPQDFAAMVEKGTKAWAGTPDNWLDELRGNDTPAAQPQDDGEKQ